MLPTHPFLRTFGLVLLLVLMMHGAVAALYLARPELFYYRAWEYFFLWANRTASEDSTWQGVEYSDLGHRYLFMYQEARETHVTTDADGFRSVPSDMGPPRILVQGRSNVFGSGVSDHETLPWQLAKTANIATFNGAHGNPLATLSRPGLETVELVVDVYHERHLATQALAENSYQLNASGLVEYKPLAREALPAHSAMMKPMLRPGWWLADIVARYYRRLRTDLKEHHLFGSRPYLAIPYRSDGSPIEDIIALMQQRRSKVENLGLDYLALVIPSRIAVYRFELIDEQTLTRGQRIVSALESQDFPVVNLYPDFLADGGESLLFKYDSHWSAKGQRVAAELTAQEIRRRWPELLEPQSTSAQATQ